MKPGCIISTIRPWDLITRQPFTDAEEVVDLGVLPIPGLFFPTAAMAAAVVSRVRVMCSESSGLFQLDRDINPELYFYYKSGRINQAHLDHVERTADELAKTYPTGARILEIGGGAGFLMRALVRRGFRHLYVIDPSTENQAGQAFHAIRGLFPGELADGDVRFDAIIGQHFLEHSMEPAAVLRASASLLAPDGQVWIEVPDIGASAMSERGEWLSIIYALHSSYFDRFTLAFAAEHAGLSNLRSFSVDHYGKSIVAVFKKRGPGPSDFMRAPVVSEDTREVQRAIRMYFSQLAEFGRNLPSGILCWGAAERCQTVLGGCIAGGFKPGPVCDSNPDLHGLYLSGMSQPVLRSADLPGRIDAVLILSPRNAEEIVRGNRALFSPRARVYVPFADCREIDQM